MNGSDLPYVQTANGVERANPVVSIEMVEFTDHSGDTGPAETPKVLFPAADNSVHKRYLWNVGLVGSLWIKLTAGDPEANAAGSIEVPPGGFCEVPTRIEVKVIGTEANVPYTALEA